MAQVPGFRVNRLCHNYLFCHSVQAERDTESRKINYFWIPASAGMTTFILIPAIAAQSPSPERVT